MVDVFISYSRDNKDRVAVIADAVKAAGYEVWWDAELPPHRSYGDVITEKIGSAKAAIVVWSHSSAQSEWVRAEADVARNQKKLVQTAIDDVMPPLPFNQIQFADLSGWHGETDHSGWRKVLLSLTELCGEGSDAPVAPTPVRPRPSPVSLPPAAYAAPAPPRSNFLPWALLALAVVAVALLAWKLTRPESAPASVVAASGVMSEDGAESTASTGSAAAEAFTLAAVINDRDGFTNVRAKPSITAAIVGKVLEGEKFLTYRQSGRWWRVRTASGTTGYMSRKLIRVLDGSDPDAAPQPMPSGVGGSGVIIPDSSERLLTAEDIAYFGKLELRLARNEIFARHGLRFKDPQLGAHFSRFGWYQPSANQVTLTDLEKANVDLLKAAEDSAP